MEMLLIFEYHINCLGYYALHRKNKGFSVWACYQICLKYFVRINDLIDLFVDFSFEKKFHSKIKRKKNTNHRIACICECPINNISHY